MVTNKKATSVKVALNTRGVGFLIECNLKFQFFT